MNEKSSRSHSIFSIMITQKEKDGGLHSFRSKVNLVDLAGSERVAQTCAVGNKLKVIKVVVGLVKYTHHPGNEKFAQH